MTSSTQDKSSDCEHPENNESKRLTATQLCVLNALQGSDAEKQRRISQTMPLNQQNDEIMSNYNMPPSVPYQCNLKGRHRKMYYYKNLFGVSAGVLFLLIAYDAFLYIQSSLNSQGGLGSLSLAVDYAMQVIACLFVPATLMKKIGCKWTLVISMLGISGYIVANFYPTFATMMPAAAIMGIGFATMWATMNTLVTDLAKGYARLVDGCPDVIMSRFFGIFYMTIQTAKIWGNLISSQILMPEVKQNHTDLHICGAAYCNQEKTGNRGLLYNISSNDSALNGSMIHGLTNATNSGMFGGVPEHKVHLLCGVSLAIAICAVLIVAALLDNTRNKMPISGGNLSHFLSTIRLLGNGRQLLLVMITIIAGLVQSFYLSDYTKAFLSCSLGIHRVGIVSTCYGVTSVIGSFTMGYLAQWTGRFPLLILAVILNVGDLFLMLWWHPNPDNIVIYFVIAGVWGIALSIWLTQLTALYGQLFHDKHEEAFSNHRMLECIGFLIGFLWEHYVCMHIKIYVILAMLFAGLIGYVALEIPLLRAKKQENRRIPINECLD